MLLAEGKKIKYLAVGAQWQSKRVGSELGRGFEVFLLTVKRDTRGANNQVSEKLGITKAVRVRATGSPRVLGLFLLQ